MLTLWSVAGSLILFFNIARLTAVAKSAGYETTALDLNIKSYRTLREKVHSKEIDFDPWMGQENGKWLVFAMEAVSNFCLFFAST